MTTQPWQEMLEEHLSCAEDDPPNYEGTEFREAREDMKGMRYYIRKAKKRRAVPEWALPLEIWWLCLHPDYRIDDTKLGLGADRAPPAAERTREAMNKLLGKIRETNTTPLSWHRSQGCPIDKPGEKTGCKGKRLIHLLDPLGKA